MPDNVGIVHFCFEERQKIVPTRGVRDDDTYFSFRIRPWDDDAIFIVVKMNYIVTGDINLAGLTIKQCEEAEQILDFVRNQIADYHWQKLEDKKARDAENLKRNLFKR